MTADIRGLVIASIREVLGTSDVEPKEGTRLSEDLGLDSLALTRLVVSIEARLGHTLPSGLESDVALARTVGDLVQSLRNVVPASGESTP